ncbi:5-(carboxyamino)imidazole ribonucleotide synthase [Nocardioides sp. zg-1308]|uniref:N5-carboxyaminoimidazole ribonucleotide synthase n=1 Tax=Nocardioides renjunii TaxID=3095075 RepID=A0ABU5KE22_9ACTN|nr:MULTISPECIES: 5-(carboxyamino)imidazole ribonucleotide synthase [unclassified Nocardioides]MDZ5662825.1 5-(carboxyamino)imidazole ribonucleotide synthase [Nocardioides sp. S-58]NPD05506.1 5-(carboxyamino)imidazole ribonucleotide synthase [Nocardioides sp. zg-1308]WQQ23392.1 5-(carboxyamino)imidazole ribonucleotide synthase [Nocardioides sp. S-34]
MSSTGSHRAPTLAVIGGGQLARMMAQPAIALGLPLRLLAEAEGVSAAQVIPDQLVGDHTDLATLRRVTEGARVVTFDHEHVPTAHLHALEADGVAVRPGPDALVHAQDKAVMRRRLAELDVPCPRNAVVTTTADVEAFGMPCVLKTTRGGYDGKGVWVVRSADEAQAAFDAATAAGVEVLAEELVDFRRELSALVARSPSGQAAAYPVVASTQLDGICHEVVAPAPDLAPALAGQAQEIALRVAGALDVTGILAVELFETTDGRILVNELAMRPHNTGHWTQDGAVTSQFENHLRAVMDLPLGSPAPRARWTVMVNILGGPTDSGHLYDGLPHAMARDPHLRVHLYGKDLRPGRKVGHVNAYGDDLDDCLERARHAAAWFRGDLGDESE